MVLPFSKNLNNYSLELFLLLKTGFLNSISANADVVPKFHHLPLVLFFLEIIKSHLDTLPVNEEMLKMGIDISENIKD